VYFTLSTSPAMEPNFVATHGAILVSEAPRVVSEVSGLRRDLLI